MDPLVFTKTSLAGTGDDTLRMTSLPYVQGRSTMTAVELGGRMVLLTEDDMIDLHAQLARSLGYID
jgi:hypothetical protein